MAITFVDANTARTGTGTSQTPTEPTGAAENDIIIAVASIGAEDGTWTDPADFTEIDNQVSSNATNHTYIGFKRRGSDAGNGYAFSYSGTGANIRVTVYALRGVDTTTALDVTYVSGSHFEEFNNDQVSIDVNITTVTANAAVVILQTMRFSSGATFGASSGYTGDFTAQGSGPQQPFEFQIIASAGAEDPGDWTHTGTNSGDDPLQFILAFKEQSAGSIINQLQGSNLGADLYNGTIQ